MKFAVSRWVCILALLLSVARPVAAEETNMTDSVASAYKQMELLTEMLLQVKKHYVEERTYD
jgi:hypothetical protein